MFVAATPASSFEDHHLFILGKDLELLIGLKVGEYRTNRHIKNEVVTILSFFASARTSTTILSAVFFVVHIALERGDVADAAREDAPTPATIAARRTREIFAFDVKPANNAVAALACFEMNR